MQRPQSPHASRRPSLSPSVADSWCKVSQEAGSSSASACPVPADNQEVWDTVPYAFADDSVRSPEARKTGSRSHTDILSLLAVDRRREEPPVQQRVSSWLEKYHGTDGTPGEGREPSPNEPSLGDFLQCRSPFRPKFLNRPRRGLMHIVDSGHGSKNSVGSEPDMGHLPRYISLTRSASETRRKVGWVARRLDSTSQIDDPAIRESAIAPPPSSGHMQGSEGSVSQNSGTRSAEEQQHQQQQQEEVLMGSGSPRPGDAEFLSYAFQGFVAFQPLDFAARAAAMAAMRNMLEDDQVSAMPSPAAEDSPPQPTREPRDSGLWSYIADFIDDFTKDITYIQ
ncbi:hypothetical protein EC988_004723 [Linderina pennispora]|nr:hypothetical protein EC988_004723 [Linderina pennispora]